MPSLFHRIRPKVDGKCRITFMVEPGGAAVDVVVDPPENLNVPREKLDPVPGKDAQIHTYALPNNYQGWYANVKVYAEGYVTIEDHVEFRVGNRVLPGYKLSHSIPQAKDISSNFLALPGFELGLNQKPGLMAWMDPNYRASLKTHGGNTVIVQPYAIYPPRGS